MKFSLAISTFFLLVLALVKGQGFQGFGFPGAFGLGLDSPIGIRDPRQNTGPVVFPPAPPDNGETSGVVPGASGYGFVPSNQPSGCIYGSACGLCPRGCSTPSDSGAGRSGNLQSFF